MSEIFFLPIPGRGQRLALHYRPAGRNVRRAVVYVHPFAEEMNKSRRMVALQARALAAAGYAVLQIDLLGCGDSSGEFGEATWDDWVADVVEGANWIREHHEAPLMLWGLRAGCLLSAEAAQRIAAPADFLFWQPATLGNTLLQQFLRLRLAGEMQGGAAKGLVASLRAQLAAGNTVEVAGYSMGPGLAGGLDRAALSPHQDARQVVWLEVSTRDEPALLPTSAGTVELWRQAGHRVTAKAVPGPAFWQTAEIEEAPALIDATLATLGATVAT